jgi:hypothetical protein
MRGQTPLIALAGFGGSLWLDYIGPVPRVHRHRHGPQAVARIRVAVESVLSGGKG